MRAVLLVALTCSGCMPVVQHGPWVRHGTSGAVGGTAGVAAEYGEFGSVAPFFSFEGGAHIGITPNDSSYKGVGIGVQLPVISLIAAGDSPEGANELFRYLNFDAYVTGPTTGETRTAIGATGSSFHLMPYVQAGRLDEWYGTLGVILLRDSEGLIIAPSFTQLRRNSSWNVTHVTYTAGVGVGGDDVAVLLGLSFIFEFHGKNAGP
jgi:hypothetical protein